MYTTDSDPLKNMLLLITKKPVRGTTRTKKKKKINNKCILLFILIFNYKLFSHKNLSYVEVASINDLRGISVCTVGSGQ